MLQKRCIGCSRIFTVRPQVPGQAYCSSTECQRLRKREWQKSKLLSDIDYQENQRAAQRAWARRNPDYWRHRRQRLVSRSPAAADAKRRQRDDVVVGRVKMDVCCLPAGVYRIRPYRRSLSNRDGSWLVRIAPIRMRRCRKMDASRDDMIDTGTMRS